MAIEPAVLPSDAPLHVATSKPAASFTSRLEAVDLLRGAVMVLMAIDHTRDFFGNVINEPMDLSQLSPAMFLTRWITHFCAPAFAFLAGTGAYLAGVRGRSRGELAAFLASRGVWLVFLELTVVKFSILFDPAPRVWYLLVFWSIGASMVVLSGLVFLPSRLVGALGVLLIATYSLIDRLPLGAFRELGVLLFQRGVIALPGGVNVIVGYPLIPWFGVVAAGYGFGEVLRWEPARRRRFMLVMGLGLTAAFVVLRAWGIYGEPRPWTTQRTPLLTALEFLNCTKNPPSPLFLLMTLGPAIAAMSVFDRLGARGAGAGPGDDRPRAAILLHPASLRDPRPWATRAGDPRRRALARHGRLAARAPGRLCRLGGDGLHPLLALPMVRRGQGTPSGRVAVVSVARLAPGGLSRYKSMLIPPRGLGHHRAGPELGQRLDVGQDLCDHGPIGPTRIDPRLHELGAGDDRQPRAGRDADRLAVVGRDRPAARPGQGQAHRLAIRAELGRILDEPGLFLQVIGLAHDQEPRSDVRSQVGRLVDEGTLLFRVIPPDVSAFALHGDRQVPDESGRFEDLLRPPRRQQVDQATGVDDGGCWRWFLAAHRVSPSRDMGKSNLSDCGSPEGVISRLVSVAWTISRALTTSHRK